jgi:hypothetical protein
MITKFTITNKGAGIEWDVKELINDVVVWKTDKDYAAGTLDFKIYTGHSAYNLGFNPTNGDIIEFHWDNRKIFYGRIFKHSTDETNVFRCLAYDNLRYLKNEGVLVFPVSTGSERFVRIMQTLELNYRQNNLAVAKLDAKVYDGQTYFSMLQDALNETNQITSDGDFFMRANYDVIELMQVYSTQTTLLIEEKGRLSQWTYERNADELYNMVKVIKEDENEGERTTFTTNEASSQASINQFGLLSKVEKADTDMNSAQMQEKAQKLLNQLSKEKQTLDITAAGTFHENGTNFRAGDRFWINIPHPLVKAAIKSNEILSQSVTHHFSNTNWIMDIKGSVM